jgi:hypothetical protein
MKRTTLALVTGALLLVGGPAHADVGGCNLKAVRHTAEHLLHAGNPVRIALLEARFARLAARCSQPPGH